ncbi:MAG: DnaJ-like cysteine-rich domain-containing protein, partial [Planctomycetota bacterium]
KWTRKSPCRTCGGRGRAQDPLLWVVCPGCHGAGCFPCNFCRNEGKQAVQGGSKKKPGKCMACKGQGGFKCSVCKGNRLVPGPALKPDVGEASLKSLSAAKQKIGLSLSTLRAFTPTHKTSKDLKAYAKALAPASKALPPLRKCQAMIKTIQKGLGKCDLYVDNDKRKAAAFDRFRIYNELYLKHQEQVIDLCIQRQEFNSNVMAKKKDAR